MRSSNVLPTLLSEVVRLAERLGSHETRIAHLEQASSTATATTGTPTLTETQPPPGYHVHMLSHELHRLLEALRLLAKVLWWAAPRLLMAWGLLSGWLMAAWRLVQGYVAAHHLF